MTFNVIKFTEVRDALPSISHCTSEEVSLAVGVNASLLTGLPRRRTTMKRREVNGSARHKDFISICYVLPSGLDFLDLALKC